MKDDPRAVRGSITRHSSLDTLVSDRGLVKLRGGPLRSTFRTGEVTARLIVYRMKH
jgi:hypothetical protein